MADSLVQRILANNADVKLRDMLGEIQRTASFFVHKADGEWEDEKWKKLFYDLKYAVLTKYHCRVDLEQGVMGDPDLTGDEIIPPNIKEKYARCKVYCAQYLEKKARR